MNKIRYIVGAKPTTKKRIIIAIIISVVGGSLIGLMLKNLIDLNLVMGNIIGICGLMLWWVPIISTMNEHWDLTDKYFEYRYFNNHMEGVKYVIDVLLDREERAVVKIRLSQIQSIKLYWVIAFGVYSVMYFPIRMKIVLKDGSVLDTDALLNKKEDFYEAFDYLKSKGVKIDDKYNLIDALRNPKLNINDYIMGIRDGKKYDKV
ncbi:hypothetical protein [uncultured Clostridium sp.]|uniref:hypothetical protein n=1 Tax=uncultured Clostridium sp. TaxID=59620 RepID=UPI0026199E8B|nr:hypothetical protein [uncultured Clostridium sp.]